MKTKLAIAVAIAFLGLAAPAAADTIANSDTAAVGHRGS